MISMTVMVERPGYDQIAPGTSDIMMISSREPANLIPMNHIAGRITTAALAKANTFQENAVTR
jgi:hypothetical protein